MNYVLVCVEKPKTYKLLDEWNVWLPFLDAIEQIPKLIEGIQRPVENVWLFPLDNTLPVLAEFLHTLKLSHLNYKVLLFENGPTACE